MEVTLAQGRPNITEARTGPSPIRSGPEVVGQCLLVFFGGGPAFGSDSDRRPAFEMKSPAFNLKLPGALVRDFPRVFERLVGCWQRMFERASPVSGGSRRTAPCPWETQTLMRRLAELTSTARDAGVVFWVADNGPGIPPEDLQSMFDRYFRRRATGYEGSGLGLPIANGIVRAHGGRMWIESTVGTGSTVYFSIPG